MPAPVALSKPVVLPQRPGRRNGNIVNVDWQQRSGNPRTFCYKPLLVALLTSLVALPGHACGLDWRYDPQRDSLMTRPTPPPIECARDGEDVNPVVLPQAEWPEDYLEEPDRGWQLTDPQFGTGRADAYQPEREATRIAEAQQYETDRSHSQRPLSDLGDLPDALSGLDYRVEFGIEYRF